MTSSDVFRVRRLYSAPDDPTQVLATCDRGAVPVLQLVRSEDNTVRTQLVPDTDESPRVRLPFPATDIAWCPFKQGENDACFLVSCQSQPLQLWDVADGSVRASYVALNDSGMNAHPRAVLWLRSPSQTLVAGAYGGVEDATQVRFFDVAVEGDQNVYAYRSSATKGPISALGQCAPLKSSWNPPPSLFALAGYLHHEQVDGIDIRQRCAAVILRGPAKGGSGSIASIRAAPEEPNLVFAAGRGGTGGQGDILCWDLRRPSSVMARLTRHITTQQHCDFALLPHLSGTGVRLVSATTESGLVVFDDVWQAGDISGRALHTSAGITSGLAAVGETAVVVALGAREYRFTPRHCERGLMRPLACAAGEVDSDTESAAALLGRKRVRELVALSDSEDDSSCGVSERATDGGPVLNVAVLSI